MIFVVITSDDGTIRSFATRIKLVIDLNSLRELMYVSGELITRTRLKHEIIEITQKYFSVQQQFTLCSF